VDTVLAWEAHRAQAAAVKGVKQVLGLGWRIAKPSITANTNDGGLGVISPIFPDERLLKNLTGSRGSRVGPAVISTFIA